MQVREFVTCRLISVKKREKTIASDILFQMNMKLILFCGDINLVPFLQSFLKATILNIFSMFVEI